MVFVNLLVDQLSGQFITFLVGPKKFTRLKDRAICFVYSLLSILDIREWPIFKKEWTKKMSGLWDRTIFIWPTKKIEKFTGQLVSKETQNHMDTPYVFCWLWITLLHKWCHANKTVAHEFYRFFLFTSHDKMGALLFD